MGIEWLIIAIIASVVVTAAVLVPYFVFGAKKPSAPPPKPPENMDPPEPPAEQPVSAPAPASHQQEVAEPAAPASPPPVAPVAEKAQEYLGNSNTREIHDLSNTKPACQIDRINEEHKVFFDNFEEAKKAMETEEYDGCRWCLTQYHTD